MTEEPDSNAGQEQEPQQPGVALEPLPREPLDPRHLSLYEISTIASSAAKSRYFQDAPTSAACAVKLLWGQELGIPPMAALSGVHMVKGKPGMHYTTIGALLKRAGYKVIPREWDEEHCVLDWWEPNPDYDPDKPAGDDNPRRLKVEGGESSWSIEEAKRAGVYKDLTPWKTYPKVMVYARALSIGARIHAPEVFFGAVYTDDELREVDWDTEAEAVEVSEAAVPDEQPPTVEATPPQPTEQLASPSQRGALWLKAKNKGMDRKSFEEFVRLTFGVQSLDRMPARLMENATEAIERYQPQSAASSPQAAVAGAPGRESPEQAGDTTQPVSPAPTSPDEEPDLCMIDACMFDATDKGLCFDHLDELRGVGSIGFNMAHPEWSES